MRQIEQRKAAELCGVKNVLFMGEEDGFLRSTKRLRKRVTREIRRIRPELIICPDPDRYLVGDNYINHPDHRNAGLVALEAIFPAADNPMFYPDMADEGYKPHKISQLYVNGHPEANVTIDITPLSGWSPGLVRVIEPEARAFAAHLGVADAVLRVV